MLRFITKLFYYAAGILSTGALLIGTALAFSFLFSLPTYLLWNALVPELFSLKAITWLQAWGLNVLCSLLFKSGSKSSS